MITSMPTESMFKEWKLVFEKYKDRIKPNRISGTELLNYLEKHYILTKINDDNALNVVNDNVMMNDIEKEKLPLGALPEPRVFYVENSGNGEKFYLSENMDSTDVWAGNINRIFVGVDLSTGFYTVEGSTMLYTEKDAKDYITAMLQADKNTTYAFAITVNDKVIGSIGAFRKDNIHSQTAEMGYYIAQPFWGQGIGTSAISKVCKFIFENTNIIRIFAEPFARNIASCKILEKNGFVYEGTLRSNAVKNGEVIDMKMYAIIKE